ncbi:sensor histidine kinase [Xylocopilactobacillus apis]|nr:GHKL domain-containing protein [Xylocopilactobacillus apis]
MSRKKVTVYYEDSPQKQESVRLKPTLDDINQKVQIGNQVFTLLVIFVFAIGIYVNYEVKRNRRQTQLATEKMMMEGYIDTLEKMQLEIQKNQHDYKNILLGIRGFMNKEGVDTEGLEDFLVKNQLIHNEVQLKSGTLNQLKGINLPAVKGLLSTKIIEAVQAGIDVKIKCSEDIEINKVDPFDLSRIIGIILDNAIEACVEQDHPKIEIMILNEQQQILIMVANSCVEPTISLKVGESSKGANRGFGLQNLRDIVRNSDYLDLETTCSNYTFTQKIFIKK